MQKYLFTQLDIVIGCIEYGLIDLLFGIVLGIINDVVNNEKHLSIQVCHTFD
jgi:hypothetical protein